MKTANSALLAILAGPATYMYADLWTFALVNGVTKRYTDYASDLVVGGQTFSSSAALVNGAKYKLQRGLQVDESDVTVFPAPTETVNGIPFVQAVRNGMFDRAIVTRNRQYMATPGDLTSNAPLIYLGEVSDVSPTRTSAVLKIKSMPNLLNIYMPLGQYAPTCRWVFGDANCTFDRSGSTESSTVMAGTSSVSINCGLSDTAGTFNSGTVTFTSGVNNGLKRSVKSYVPGTVTLNGPFPNLPSVGDTFTIAPGCSHNFGGPTSPFNGSVLSGGGTSTPNQILCGLSNSAGFFNGGNILFTTGANVGQVRTVSSWANGLAILSSPLPNTPTTGDEFVITAVSTQTISTCSGYSNTIHFGGFPYIPVPETAT